MTLLGSGYKIEQATPSHLQVLAPASGFVWIAFALAACATAFFLHRMYKRRTAFPALGILLISGPLLLTGVRFAKDDGVRLDKDANTATAYHPSLLGNSNESVPLSGIAYADLRVMGPNSSMVLVRRHEDALTFGYSTKLANKAEAVAAINQFLGRTRPVQ